MLRILPLGRTVLGFESIGTHERHRPATNFGDAAVVAHFRGPYADGPPPADLEVVVPPIGDVGWRELRRMIAIYAVLSWCVLAGLARKLAKPRSRTWFEAASHGAVDGFERLGPTFVKLGQLVASSPGLFPDPLSDACQRCLDEVPPFPAEHVRAMVRKDLGRPPNQIFRHFDERPLSAASIGQVHACTLPDGREAVVKLQRPDILATMTTDLRIVHRLARTLERFFTFARQAGAVAVVEDLHAVTFGELNPALEAWRQHRFREGIGAFGDNKFITAPEVYWDYCGPHMICMERMSGIPMDEFETLAARGVDGELVLRRGAKVWIEALLVHGPFHGDMHAGNIWVLDDGRATYLDFGIMGELPPQWNELVRDLLFTLMIDQDFIRIARAYRRLGVFPEDAGTDEELGERLGMIVGPMLHGGVAAMNLGEMMKSSLDLLGDFEGTSPKELVLVTKQLLYIERYTKGLAPDYKLVNDVFLVKNVFPAAAAARAEALGIEFPD